MVAGEEELSSLDWLSGFSLRKELPWLSPDQAASTDTSPESWPPKRRKALLQPSHCQCTFSCLIFRAIEESGQKALPLQGIYEWILAKYPEFADRGAQWQRSLRHSLSLNASFVRFRSVKGRDFGSRGCWWTVHPDYRRCYAASVLRQGPQHRCLPRTGPRSKFPLPTAHSTSQMELSALEADLRAAATICALRGAEGRGEAGGTGTSPSSDPSARKRRRKNPTPLKRMWISQGAVADEHCYTHEATSSSNASPAASATPTPTPPHSAEKDTRTPAHTLHTHTQHRNEDDSGNLVINISPKEEDEKVLDVVG